MILTTIKNLSLEDLGIGKVLYLTRFFLVKKYKYLIGDLYEIYKAKTLNIIIILYIYIYIYITFLKTRAYVKSYDEQTKWIYVFIEKEELLGKHDTLWDKLNADDGHDEDTDFYD